MPEEPPGEWCWRVEKVEKVLQERPCFCGCIGHPFPKGPPKS